MDALFSIEAITEAAPFVPLKVFTMRSHRRFV